MKDSIINSFKIDTLNLAYKTWLPAQVYLGGRYHIDAKQNFGLLLYSQFFDKALHPGMSLSYSAQVGRWFNGSVSYSIVNRSYMNVGVGLSFKAGPVQLYFITDNVLGPIFPQSTKNINVRFGWNFPIGKVNSKKNIELSKTSTPVFSPKSDKKSKEKKDEKPANAPKPQGSSKPSGPEKPKSNNKQDDAPKNTTKPKGNYKQDEAPRPEGAPKKVITPNKTGDPKKDSGTKKVEPPKKQEAPKQK